jgi:hypothetical protein
MLVATIAPAGADDRLTFEPPAGSHGKQVVLLAGDEEYRSEESLPMLAKILSQKHGFRCTVIFPLGPDGAAYIDPNNAEGLGNLELLDQAELLVIATRFRTPGPDQAASLARYLNAGKPVIGLRTATHAFKGKGNFTGLEYGDFGLKILGETWVSHHGKHKVEGGRSVVEVGKANHPILRGVGEIFTVSDIYGVIHLGDNDEVLLRGAVTESLDPKSPNVAGDKNQTLQPLAWVRTNPRPGVEGTGRSFCTTAGASIDFVDEDLRRLVVNAALSLTGLEVPAKADVDFVDPFHPSFYGFIREPDYWKKANRQPADFGLGKSLQQPDPPGSPAWPHRP